MKKPMSNLTYISPFFMVANLENSLAFYVDKLGFKVLFTGPDDDPFFAIVGRDNISLMLKAAGEPVPNHTRHEWARWDAFIHTVDPGILFEEYSRVGATFHQPLKIDGDGLFGFEIEDADGYILFFGRPNT
ncbi:VOC family protein [Mucilaginibacter sp. CAU 1740]|uniref:VOC family protein n=1 Tax=Mucilaginibacter sp. CAU 1740 TaxID=3140365 RepID=UPI00325BDE22